MINFGGYLIKQFGAYIRTDLTGLVDINGVASGVIGMVGLAEKGPVDEAVEIDSYTQLVETFGDGPLVRHALASYVGGANRIIAVRVGAPAASSLTAVAATSGAVTLEKDYKWLSREKGTLGNNISISVAYQDTADGDTETDDYLITIKYVDSRGNDIRETFVLPRYVPNPVSVIGGTTHYRYYTGNTTDYFILRDRETGVVREIPDSWDYGNADLDAFVEKVEQLKSTDEDLVGPFAFGTGTNAYPIPIVEQVINNGGMGFAPSQLVTLADVDPVITDFLYDDTLVTYDPDATTTDILVDHPFVRLAGGDNGDDGTNYYGIYDEATDTWDYDTTFDRAGSTAIADSWDVGLGVMENEEVNFIQPAYLFNMKDGSNTLEWDNRYSFFKSVVPRFLSHINTMSSIPGRQYRTMVAGTPYYKTGTTVNGTSADFLDAIGDISGTINSDRVQLWVGGFRSSAFSSSVENYGADMLASFAVGAHAAREVSVSLTFAQLSGIFTDGLEFNFTNAQKDELYSRRHAFVMKRRNSAGATEFIAAHNYTSFTGASSRGLQLFITRRIVDYMNTFVYKNLEENYIGRKSRGAQTAAEIRDYTIALLNRLVREDVLVAFDRVNVYADANDKTVYYVEYDFQPVTEIDFIPVTNKLLYSLA